MLCCLLLLLWHIAPAVEEVVSLSPEEGVRVELKAEVVEPEGERVPAPGVCVWRNRLWRPTATNPPRRVLVSGVVTIEGEPISLDVSGLAEPWADAGEMKDYDCRISKLYIGEDGRETCYVLEVCFFKGGAMDYLVTWLIYQNVSLRAGIEAMGDVYPEWYLGNREPGNPPAADATP